MPITQAQEPYAPYRFTARDYYKMAEADILGEDARVELIDGQILVKEPPGPEHASHGSFLEEVLIRLLGHRALVRSQYPVDIDDLNNPEPDVAVVRRRDDHYRHAHPRPQDVLLVIEIAWSSATGDRRLKAPLYGRAGIPEFWLVDIQKQKLEVYRDPSENGYRSFRKFGRDASVELVAFPDITLTVSEILLH